MYIHKFRDTRFFPSKQFFGLCSLTYIGMFGNYYNLVKYNNVQISTEEHKLWLETTS